MVSKLYTELFGVKLLTTVNSIHQTGYWFFNSGPDFYGRQAENRKENDMAFHHNLTQTLNEINEPVHDILVLIT